MSELAKSQKNTLNEITNQSASKKKKLFDEELNIQSELSIKGIRIEDPVLDVKKVFALPSRYKRRKQEGNCSPDSDFSKNSMTSGYDIEKTIRQNTEFENNFISNISCFYSNVSELHMEKFNEPELLFKEIQNIQPTQVMQEFNLSFKEKTNSDFEYMEFGKENDANASHYEETFESAYNGNAAIRAAQPYVAPPFAKIFNE